MPPQRISPETELDNAALLDALRAGDREAWRQVAVRFRKRLRDLAAATLPANVAAREDASDIVQDTFKDAAQSIAAFGGDSVPELYAWLAVALNHNVDDAIRRHLLAQRRSVKVECRLDDSAQNAALRDGIAADQTSPSVAAGRNETNDRLSAALERLPPRQRVAVRMRHLEGRTLSDIASQLHCTEQAAAAVLARGLRALRIALQELT